MNITENIIAMLVLQDAAPIDPEAVATRLRAMFPWHAKSVGAPSSESGQGDTCLIPFGDGVAPVIQIHEPIPRETLDFALSQNLFWQGAEQALESSRAHIIVSSVAPTNDPRYMRANAERVTCVTAALLDLLPIKGVYWTTSESLIESQFFLDQVEATGQDGTPFDAWVAVRFFPGPNYQSDHGIIARTMGLAPFIGREVECGPYPKGPEELGPLVRGVGHYILDKRVEFSDGETIGTDENPIASIELSRTQVGNDHTAIYRLVLTEVKNG